MEVKDFLADLESVLEVYPGAIALTDELATLGEWNSLAVLGFLALADGKYGVTVPPALLRSCRNVGDLMNLVQKS